jgi:hypothetical protein
MVVMAAMALIQVASLSHPKGEINRAIALNRLVALPFLAIVAALNGVAPLVMVFGVLGVCVAVLIADMAAWDRADQAA